MRILIPLIVVLLLPACAEFKAGYAQEMTRRRDLERANSLSHSKSKASPQNIYTGAAGGGGYSSALPTRSSGGAPLAGYNRDRYDSESLSNPYGAGSPYKSDGLMNPYSRYGSEYSNESWTNPYATNAPKIYGEDGTYHGRLSTNPYDSDSISNPYGTYGSKYSSESLNNPYGAGNPFA